LSEKLEQNKSTYLLGEK